MNERVRNTSGGMGEGILLDLSETSMQFSKQYGNYYQDIQAKESRDDDIEKIDTYKTSENTELTSTRCNLITSIPSAFPDETYLPIKIENCLYKN